MTSHSNNFLYKLCSNDTLVRSHLIAHVTLRYTSEKSILIDYVTMVEGKKKFWSRYSFFFLACVFSWIFFQSKIFECKKKKNKKKLCFIAVVPEMEKHFIYGLVFPLKCFFISIFFCWGRSVEILCLVTRCVCVRV